MHLKKYKDYNKKILVLGTTYTIGQTISIDLQLILMTN
jgi:hypothetical protein